MIFGGTVFWITIPFFIIILSPYFDHLLHLPRFRYGLLNPVIALVFMVSGWLFANWTVKAQYSIGKGTPIPLVATQKLVVRKPYTYCRNPMALGTSVFYLGIAVWMGSLSALGLGLIYPVEISIYNRFIEEKELEDRFGREYLEYKRRTPFIIPRLQKKP